MRRSFERRAVIKYRLRACGALVHQEGLDGGILEHILEFLPARVLEAAIQRLTDTEKGMTLTIPPLRVALPEAHEPRQVLKRQVEHFSVKRKKLFKDELSLLLRRWKRGNAKELALYHSTYLLMWKLSRIATEMPKALAPCVVTLEDDAVTKMTFLHAHTLRQLCQSTPSADAWQLMWQRGHVRDYRKQAHDQRDAYDSDGVAEGKYWATAGVMWSTPSLPQQLKVVAFDDNATKAGPYLECFHQECITDHFDPATTRVKVPITPWVSNPIADRSTGLHADALHNHRVSVRAMTVTLYGFEWQSFGMAASALHQNSLETLKDSQGTRLDALKFFHEHPRNVIGADVYDHSEPGRWLVDIPPPTEVPSTTKSSTMKEGLKESGQ